MTRDEIFEIAHHFYRMGFFQTKEGQFKRYFDEYLELLKQDGALLQADVNRSGCDKADKIILGAGYCPNCLKPKGECKC